MTSWLAYPLSFGELHKSVRQVHPGRGWDMVWKRVKLVGRGVVFGRWNVRWQQYLNTPFMRPIAAVQPQLFLKIQLPYLNRNYDVARRMQILQANYTFMRDVMGEDLRLRLLLGEPIGLTRWAMSTGTFSLRLGLTRKYWQEGEMELDLYHEGTKRVLAFIHFCVTGPSEISIGCLQGGKPVENPDEISNREIFAAFKKDMHGMRHKSLLVFAMRRLAQVWGLNTLRAVSSEAQLWGGKVLADYNTFWTEEGGVLGADGMFELPLVPENKERSKKRSMYQRREQCLELLGREIAESIAAPWRAIGCLDLETGKAVAESAEAS